MEMADVTISETKILWVFTVALVAFTIGYVVVDVVFDMLLGVTIPGHMMNVLIAMGAAMMAGDFYYKRAGQMPEKSLSWRMAALFTVINLAVAVVAFGGLALVTSLVTAHLMPNDHGDAGFMMMDHEDFILFEYWWVLVVLLVFLAIGTLLACRLSFYLGAKSAKKYLENQALKASRKLQ